MTERRSSHLRSGGGRALMVAVAGFIGAAAAAPAMAQFYIGPSYLSVTGVLGDAKEPAYRNWIRAEARIWSERPKLPEIRGINGRKDDLLFTGTTAPPSGPNVLTVAVDKNSRGLSGLMEKCRAGGVIDQLRFAESSEIARHPQEHGKRPADVPEYYEFVLTGVKIECPAAANAPEQALVLRFQAIRWLNSTPQATPRPISAVPASLPPVKVKGATRALVVTWFAAAVDVRPDQCPRMNTKPSEADYFALMSAEKAARVRASLGGAGVGPDRMPYRGPDELNVGLLPGIVPDPGHFAPTAEVAQGLDLDDHLGSGVTPKGIRPHKNFKSPDGRPGVDNQLYTVEGCVEGLRRKGFLPMIFNEGRAAGRPSALIEIRGIDDYRNDPEVWVTFYYSSDDLRRSPAKIALPDFTYRVSNSPEYSQDFVRIRGKIVDGVITTDPAKTLHMHEVTGIETTIVRPRMRFQLSSEGRLKGVIGGYVDWRKRLLFQIFRSADYENTVGFQAPAIYNAMKRAADGLQNPATGEFEGISAAFEIEAVPAFLPPEQHAALGGGNLQVPTLAKAREGMKLQSASR